MLHTTRPVSRFCFTPLALQACMLHITRPASFTPHVLQAYMLHTTRPESLHALHHPSCEIHTTLPASLHASHHNVLRASHHTSASLHVSHHVSWKPLLLHTTRPASFTPHILQACMFHTTRPASQLCFISHVLEADFVPHHSSCKPPFKCVARGRGQILMLPGAEKKVSPWMRPDPRQGDPEIAPVLPVRYPVPPKVSASYCIWFGSQEDE